VIELRRTYVCAERLEFGEKKEFRHDRCRFCPGHDWIFRDLRSLHPRIREDAMSFELGLVLIVAIGLLVYLFWTLIRPDMF
jgi:K+-transporting ATPase KdpF subunit